MKTKVIFRKFKSDGDIIALFPYEIYNNEGGVMSYMHLGQHGEANYLHILSVTVPATKDEYCQLYNELTGIGYSLSVGLKRNYDKYLAEYKKLIFGYCDNVV